jgi:hypothetical protein
MIPLSYGGGLYYKEAGQSAPPIASEFAAQHAANSPPEEIYHEGKRFLLGILALALVFGFAGCSSDSGGGNGSQYVGTYVNTDEQNGGTFVINADGTFTFKGAAFTALAPGGAWSVTGNYITLEGSSGGSFSTGYARLDTNNDLEATVSWAGEAPYWQGAIFTRQAK